ncbi:helix-turn-helix domain-containing protein [Burkholderia lata]|nr:helix-turn-helix domain-containing protein [Burkholderia lata]
MDVLEGRIFLEANVMIDSGAHPPRREGGVSCWSEQIRHRFFPLELNAGGSGEFDASVDVFDHARCRVARISASAHSASIGRDACKTLKHRYIKVIWQLSGVARLEQGACEVIVPPGHFTLYEASSPYWIQSDAHGEFVTMLCEVADHDALLALARHAIGRAMPTTGGAAVALASLQAMIAEGRRMNPRSRFGVLELVATLLAETIDFTDGTAPASRRKIRETLLRDAQQYIHRHLDDGELSPDRIAAALKVCRRTLYQAFESIGERPQAMIQRLRLEKCHEVLSQTGADGASITRLALQSGFSDPAYFARLFRRRFGVTPSQCRDAAMQDGGGADSSSESRLHGRQDA